MTDILDINHIKSLLKDFADERNWEQYHHPKNLAMALAGEAGELMEIFQWLSEAESKQAVHDPVIKQQTSHEIADVLLYAIQLAAKMDINLSQAIREKMVMNGEKYPAGVNVLYQQKLDAS